MLVCFSLVFCWSSPVLSAAFSIARSGLAAESLRVRVVADNIGNASTPGYTPQRVEQATLETGGVRAVARPVAAFAAGLPAVDVIQETASLKEAQAAYQANFAVIETVDEMFESLLDAIDHDDRDDRRDRSY